MKPEQLLIIIITVIVFAISSRIKKSTRDEKRPASPHPSTPPEPAKKPEEEFKRDESEWYADELTEDEEKSEPEVTAHEEFIPPPEEITKPTSEGEKPQKHVSVADMQLTPEKIRQGIIIGEILKRKF